jgi:hypothetical protein
MAKEVDWNDDEMRVIKEVAGEDQKGGAVNQNDKEYQTALNSALSKLYTDAKKYLTPEALKSYSPKFAEIVPKLNACVGKALVYSQFRTVEGLGVLSLALKANGWCELALKKTASGWDINVAPEDINKPKYFQYYGGEEDTKLLMKIFNNQYEDLPDGIRQKLQTSNLRGETLKVIMITQSGAEGISLKHVRQVHVIEPYWNEIRINQVIGRAIRAGSHLDLPMKERDVQIFRYIVGFTRQQLKDSNTIKNKDGGMTTDQYIDKVAQNKMKIINRIQTVMKDASVDCMVHRKYHDKSVSCLQFPENVGDDELSYQLDLANEEPDSVFKKKTKRVTTKMNITKCMIDDVPYGYDKANLTLYDYPAMMQKKLVKVAVLQKIPRTDQFKMMKV